MTDGLLTTTVIRRGWVTYATNQLGWDTKRALREFETWLDERREVALTTFVCTLPNEETTND